MPHSPTFLSTAASLAMPWLLLALGYPCHLVFQHHTEASIFCIVDPYHTSGFRPSARLSCQGVISFESLMDTAARTGLIKDRKSGPVVCKPNKEVTPPPPPPPQGSPPSVYHLHGRPRKPLLLSAVTTLRPPRWCKP